MREIAINSLQDLSLSITHSIDTEIEKMITLSMNITFSPIFKESVNNHLQFDVQSETDAERIAKYENEQRIIEIINSIIGPYKPVPQVNFFDFNGGMVGAGVYSRSKQQLISELDWITIPEKTSGSYLLSLPHTDPLLGKTFPIYKGKTYISLFRAIINENKNAVGMIEVKQFTEVVFQELHRLNSNIIVFNKNGTILYPRTDTTRQVSMELINSSDQEIFFRTNSKTGEDEISIASHCKYADWKILLSKEEQSLLEPVYHFTTLMIVLAAALLVTAVIIASRLSKRVTGPLRNIHYAIMNLDWNSLTNKPSSPVFSGLDELEELQLAFNTMHQKLQDSMNEVLEARTHEIEAAMLALQSQMDPHFVYNMLTTIGIMAEEGMNQEINETIDHMTYLLRYISSRTTSLVTVGEELEYVKRYLSCMKIRFADSLEYCIDIPEDVANIVVPKLIIQPVIENALKYGMNSEPPWELSVEGSRYGSERWQITIRDNGPGFSKESLEEIQSRIEENKTKLPETSLEISGMGLVNIATRLYLYYGTDSIFITDNREGAVVTIGGPYEPQKST
ncbi:MAG: histidine kinase [Spirochaetales bacterium]|nr:histidine kinase [Spirochaetales bacterium]